MKRKFIPVEESFARRKKEPGYAGAYSALGAEFDDPEEGLRQGLEDIAEGRTRPAREVFEELRAQHRIPR
jgi:hypothetical protein